MLCLIQVFIGHQFEALKRLATQWDPLVVELLRIIIQIMRSCMKF